MRAFIILPCSLFYMCRLIKNDTNFQKEVRNFDTSKNFFKKICKRNLVGVLKKLIEANITVLNYMKRLIFNYSFG